jgi:hypothetical protein
MGRTYGDISIRDLTSFNPCGAGFESDLRSPQPEDRAIQAKIPRTIFLQS